MGEETGRKGLRPGGRSARVQAAVHAAVRDLLAERERGEISVPLVAARAGVTPSTIYRRWGDLQDLLADVALEQMRPDTDPAETGTLRGDLIAWVDQYREEMSSAPGTAMIRDVLASLEGSDPARQCCAISQAQLSVIFARAAARGEAVPDLDLATDLCIAPVVYRILFTDRLMDGDYVRTLVDRLLMSLRP